MDLRCAGLNAADYKQLKENIFHGGLLLFTVVLLLLAYSLFIENNACPEVIILIFF